MNKIKQVRIKKNMTRYRLAKDADLDYSTLRKVESGGDVKLSTLRKIAAALGVDVKDLV